jgi:hypothetical protein
MAEGNQQQHQLRAPSGIREEDTSQSRPMEDETKKAPSNPPSAQDEVHYVFAFTTRF